MGKRDDSGRYISGNPGNPYGRRGKPKPSELTDEAIEQLSEDEIEAMAKGELVRRSIDPATPSYALPKISQRLEEIAERERAKADKTHWSRSVQVRPDYQPPNWEEVLGYAGSIGAFGADNVVAQADKHGWLGELRTAVGKTTESEEAQ